MSRDTVHRFEYPPALALLNRALEPLNRATSLGDLSPLAIAQAACRAENLPSPRDSAELAALLGDDYSTAIELCTNWPLSAMGGLQWRALLVGSVRVRLQLQRYLENGGQTAPLRQPLFVVGLPRSGTTFLQYLLSSLNGHRGLSFWELMRPIPRPERRFDELKRRMHGALASSVFRVVAPEFKKIHQTTATTLEECWYLFMPSFRVMNADFVMPHAQYGDWMLGSDMAPAYQRYRTLLEVLQHQVGEQRLVLKCPDHTWFLGDLMQAFPEAKVMWIHRDPAKSVPSYAAQMALPGRQYMGRVDPQLLGERLVSRFEQGIARAELARTGVAADRLVDVRYHELAADPVGSVDRALRALGEERSQQDMDAMRQVLAMKRSDGKGKHSYRAETYGLSREGLHATFGEYMDRYGLLRE